MTESSSSSVDSRPVPSGRRAEGTLSVPGSKSATQRYFNLALLAASESEVRASPEADDTRCFARALETVGMNLSREDDSLHLTPGPPPSAGSIDCGDGGTMARFLTASLCAIEGDWLLDGSPRLRERPLGALVAALRSVGGTVDFLDRDGFLPLRIRGGQLQGGSVEIDCSLSSQFLSALLMSSTRGRLPCDIRVVQLVSSPYVDLTLAAMEEFGIEVQRPAEDRFLVSPGHHAGASVTVEPDLSAACYPAAAAALTAGDVRIRGVRRGSLQGDRRFFDLLSEMGARVDWEPEGVRVAAADGLRAVDVDLSELPDQVPTLAALAPFARGTTTIRNVPHLRLKESDHLSAMARELTRTGARVDELEDGLLIPGIWADDAPPSEPVRIRTYGDHRIAMSMSLLGLRRPAVTICDAAVVSKSYPAFWEDLDRLLEGSENPTPS